MPSNGKADHILWLDGLKGLACLGVVWHHYMLRFFPASYYGGPGTLSVLSQLPFWGLVNGNFLLLLFFFCSGFVVPLQNTHGQNPALLLGRRYLRLAPPLWLCCAATYLFYKVGLLSGFDFGPAAAPSLRAVAECGLVRILFLGDITFSGAFWMMGQLFWSGCAVLLLCRFLVPGPLRTALLAGAGLVCYLFFSTFCAALFWGAAVSCLLSGPVGSWLAQQHKAAWLLLPGLFLGGYPSGRAPTNVYALLWRPAVSPPGTTSALTFQLLGLALIFAALWACPALQRPLAGQLPLMLAKLSYPLYVFHVLVICLLADLFYPALSAAVGQGPAVWLLLAVVLAVLLAVARGCQLLCARFAQAVNRLLPN